MLCIIDSSEEPCFNSNTLFQVSLAFRSLVSVRTCADMPLFATKSLDGGLANVRIPDCVGGVTNIRRILHPLWEISLR